MRVNLNILHFNAFNTYSFYNRLKLIVYQKKKKTIIINYKILIVCIINNIQIIAIKPLLCKN